MILNDKAGAAGSGKKRSRAVTVLYNTGKVFLSNEMEVYAGSSTLRILTAIFPLFILIIAVLNWIPAYSPEDFADIVFSVLPDLPEFKAFFTDILQNLKTQTNGVLASFAAVTTLWSASTGISSIQRGLQKIMPTEKNGLFGKLISLLFTLGLIIMIPVIITARLFNSQLRSQIEEVFNVYGETAVFQTITGYIRSAGFYSQIIAFIVVLLVYRFLPGGKRSWRDQIPGTLFTVIVWYLFNELFSLFIPLFWKSSVYGSLASLFMIILWIQVCIVILFAGAALNQAIVNSRKSV